MFAALRQSISSPARVSDIKTSPARTQRSQINTTGSEPVEVIELSSSPSPQETHSGPSQALRPLPPLLSSPKTPEDKHLQQRTQQLTPVPYATTPSTERTPHNIFKPIKIHTAKCDVCNKHNKDTLQRCIDCGWQICTPCWDSRGGNGTHGSTRKFNGTVYRSSEDDQPQKKTVQRRKNSGSGLKSPLVNKTKISPKSEVSLPIRSDQANALVKGIHTELPEISVTDGFDSSGRALPSEVNSSSASRRPQRCPKAQTDKRRAPAPIPATIASSSLLRQTSIGRSRSPISPPNFYRVEDAISSCSSLTSLSVLEEECGYGGDEEMGDDDATEIDPGSEDIIMVDGKTYEKRPFQGLSPNSETRMNWLLIAAEEALQGAGRYQITDKMSDSTPVADPTQISPAAPSQTQLPTSVQSLTTNRWSAPVENASLEQPSVSWASKMVPGQFHHNIKSTPNITQNPDRALIYPVASISPFVTAAVPISQLIPSLGRKNSNTTGKPGEVHRPKPTRHPGPTARRRYGQLENRQAFYPLDVPVGFRGIVPGIHMFKDSKAAMLHQREMRELRASNPDKMEVDEDVEEVAESRDRSFKPHARAWEL